MSLNICKRKCKREGKIQGKVIKDGEWYQTRPYEEGDI